ncbi:restriction endonuclease subunit S [Bacillus thuringiensis]|nr:restriction endonuclease subunit S [Bacillus thuringiensis]
MIFKQWFDEKVEDLCNVSSSKRIYSREYVENGIPFYRSKEIIKKYNKEKLDDVLYISEERFKEIEYKFGSPSKGDILLTSIGTLGIPYVVQQNEKFYFKDGNLLWFKNFSDKLSSVFLYYWIQSPLGKEEIDKITIGSTQKALTIESIKKINIKLPDREEQNAIVNILSSLDEKIETNNQITRKLEETAQAIYRQWFVDFEFPNEDGAPYKSSGGAMVESELGMIPKGWECSKATDQFIVQSGGTPKTSVTEYWNGEIPFFTPKDSHVRSVFVIETEKNITQEGLSKCNSKLYDAGTVFITARGTVGQVAMAGRKMAMNQSCYALVPNDGFTYNYVYFLTLHLVAKLKINASGSVFNAITVSTFANIKTIMPSRAVVRKFDVIIKSLFSLILNKTNENKQLRVMRDTLLPKLMSGEVRVPVK